MSGQQAARTIAGVGSEMYLLNILGAKKNGFQKRCRSSYMGSKKKKIIIFASFASGKFAYDGKGTRGRLMFWTVFAV